MKFQQKTLEKKLRYWQRVLKLSDWDIKIKYAPQAKLDHMDDLANIDMYDSEQVAEILVSKNCYSHHGYGKSWNIDTLILHELIHIILERKKDHLPKRYKLIGGSMN